jgi:hypothetical protein
MTTETDRILNPVARQFHGYDGNAPIHLGRDLHIDELCGKFFVGNQPGPDQDRTYVSRLELIEAAQNILRHFGASA